MASIILCDRFEPEDIEIIPQYMKASLTLSRDDVEILQKEATTNRKVDYLFTMLCRKPVEAYYSLLHCLYNVREDLFNEVRSIQREKVKGNIIVYPFQHSN